MKAATHRFMRVEREHRNAVVVDVVNSAWPSIIFSRTRHGADRVAKQLERLGVKTAPIHGGRSQSQRQRALDDFSGGRVHALVATDVAARGIHVDGVASVIHYDPPADHKDYVHRSGRTARAGRDGLVVSLVLPEHVKHVRNLQRDVGLDEPITDAATPTGATPPPLAPAVEQRPARRDQREQRPAGGPRRNNQHRRRRPRQRVR